MRRSFPGVALALLGSAGIFGACSSDAPEVGPPDASVDAASADVVDTPRPPPVDAAEAAATPDAPPGITCRGMPLPPSQHFVAPGMCATLVASGLGIFRQITFAPNGDLLGVNVVGSLLRFRDLDGDGFFQPSEITEYAATLGNTNNCHLDAAGGYLYAGTPFGVQRFPYSAAAASGGAAEDVITDFPLGGHHHRTVHVYDGYLYVSSSSADNADNPNGAEYDDNRSLIRRFQLSAFAPGTPLPWLSGEVVTKGLRNANGFTRNAAGRMYAVVNGMDSMVYENQDVYEDNPGEQLVEIAMGKAYGFPFCFTAQRIISNGGQLFPAGTQLYNQSTGVHDNAWCAANSSPPTTFFQAHSAPLDITFFDTHPKGALPERYRGGAFVALHGSWDRTVATGYKVVWVPFDAAGKSPMPVSTATTTTFAYETVFGGGDTTGPKDGPWSWADKGYGEAVRPAGVAISPVDGALYVSTDTGGGNLYRVGAK
jgi:glucose/arabinose dehydrogenase